MADFSEMIGKIQKQLGSLGKLRKQLEDQLRQEVARNNTEMSRIDSSIQQETSTFRQYRDRAQQLIDAMKQRRAVFAAQGTAAGSAYAQQLTNRIRNVNSRVLRKRIRTRQNLDQLRQERIAEQKKHSTNKGQLSASLAANAASAKEGRDNIKYLYDEQDKAKAADAEQLKKNTQAVIGSFAALNQILQSVNNVYRIETQRRLALMSNNTLDAEIAEKRKAGEIVGTGAQMAGAGIGFAVGGPIGAAVGAAAGTIIKTIIDSQVARIERQRDMEKATTRKVGELGNMDAGVAMSKAMMDINKTMMALQEARTLSPTLQEYSKLQIELDTLRLQESMTENIKSIKDNMEKMKQELIDRKVANFEPQTEDEKKRKSYVDFLNKTLGVSPEQADRLAGGYFSQKIKDSEEKAKEARKRSEGTWKSMTDTLRKGIDRVQRKSMAREGIRMDEDADVKSLPNLMGG